MIRVDAYPVLGRFVIWIADALILCLQILNALRLAFQRDDREIIAIEERKHVALNVKHQHPLSILEFPERQFLFNICA